jgi:hypothetical protein
MLHGFLRCRNAPQRPPLREARVVFFAKAKGASGTPDLNENDEFAREAIEETKSRVNGIVASNPYLQGLGATDAVTQAAARLFAEMRGKKDEDTIRATKYTVAEAKASNAILGEIIETRLRFDDPFRNKSIGEVQEEVSSRTKATIDGEATPEGKKVDTEAKGTREDVEKALKGDAEPDEAEERAPTLPGTEKLLEELNSTSIKLTAVIADVEAMLQATEGTDIFKDIDTNRILHDLHEMLGYTSHLRDFVTQLSRWEHGLIAPTDFTQWLREEAVKKLQHAGIDPDIKEQWPQVDATDALIATTRGNRTNDLSENMLPDLTSPTLWAGYNEGTKIPAIRKVDETLKIGSLHVYIREYLNTVNERTSKSAAFFKDQRKLITEALQLNPKGSEEAVEAAGGSLWQQMKDALGVDFVSPIVAWESAMEVWQAFDDWKKNKRQLKKSILSSNLGKIIGKIPGLKEVQTSLDIKKSKEMDERKNTYLSQLKSKDAQPGFRALFDQGGLIDNHRDDPLWCMAILEYASEKGYLYDIDRYSTTKRLLGRIHIESLLPADWNSTQTGQYIGDLWYANRGGREKQIKAGYEINFTNPDNAIKSIASSLEGRDLHFSLGLAQKAFEKGKESYVAGWIAATFLRAFEDDPKLRSYLTEEYLELLAKYAGGYSIAFSAGSFYFERGQVLQWAASGSDNIRGMGRFGNTVADVRQEILEKDPTLTPRGSNEEKKEMTKILDKYVADVITCNVKKLPNGKFVTLFQKKYFPYNRGSGKQHIIDFAKIDEVYFEAPSEILMADQNIIAQQLLRTISPQGFADPQRSFLFLKNVLAQREELLKSAKEADAAGDVENARELREAEAHFREMMSGKLWEWLKIQLGLEAMKGLAIATHKGQEEAPILPELVRNGLIKRSDIESNPGKWGKILLQEVDSPGSSGRTEPSKPKKGRAEEEMAAEPTNAA